MGGAEKRSHRRFKMSVPVSVRPKNVPSPVQTTTEDISASGIYFTLPSKLEVGAELECELVLPAVFQGSTVPIRCRGRIVRVEECDERGRIGIAVNLVRYEFIRTETTEHSQVAR